MKLKITPEIQTALEQYPDGPIRLENDRGPTPVYLVRPDDMVVLQDLMDRKIMAALAEADADIAAGRVVDWDPQDIMRRGRESLERTRNV